MSTDSPEKTNRQLRIGFLGPAGTFSEQVILRQADLAQAELVAYPLMTDVLFAVAEGEIDQGVVPVENAIEGTVNAIVDTMAFDVDVLIQREMLEPVSLNLLVQPGASIDQVTRLISIPVASSQCRTWLRDHLPSVEYVAANSNAQAAELAAAAQDPTVAALANARAAELYGLELAAAEIEDHPENSTRFVLVSRTGVPAPTGQDKTSIVVYQRADTPGSLLRILQEFAARSINLSLLLSRPTKTSLGEYCFMLDLEGHIADPIVADCLRSLRAHQANVKFLGSYPAAATAAPAAREQHQSDNNKAEAWLDAYIQQIGS